MIFTEQRIDVQWCRLDGRVRFHAGRATRRTLGSHLGSQTSRLRFGSGLGPLDL
jgi:hypothetical protein